MFSYLLCDSDERTTLLSAIADAARTKLSVGHLYFSDCKELGNEINAALKKIALICVGNQAGYPFVSLALG